MRIVPPVTVKLPLSPGLYVEDIGKNWADQGVITQSSPYFINCMTYGGYGGLLFFGDAWGKVYRSDDYGLTWSYIQVAGATDSMDGILYCGDGILLVSELLGNIHRSTDYGATWTDLGVIHGGRGRALIYCNNGIVVLADSNGHIFRSIDYGATWTDLGAISSNDVWSMAYCDNGIVLFGDEAGHVFRSTDYGATWTDLGAISSNGIRSMPMAYCGEGRVLFGTAGGSIFRSVDYGLTWSEIYSDAGDIRSMAYAGNGVILAGDTVNHIFRSDDYGLNWSDLGVTGSGGILSMICGSAGVTVFGDSAGHIYRSDCSFKVDESTLDCVPTPVNIMDFWSDIDGSLTLPADTALPDIVIADLPTGASVLRAILMLKYSAKKDTSTSDNKITAGKIQSKEKTGGTYVDAINLIDGEASVDASTKEGGDIHVGDNDVSGTTSDIVDNCTVQSAFSGVTTTGASIVLYDVQVGIRLYFT